MELRTKILIEPSPFKINYDDGVVFIGSCFATSIGSKMEAGLMKVMVNPAGSVYNPVSVCNTIEAIITGREYIQDDLFLNDEMWLSFYHYTEFSSSDPLLVLDKINKRTSEALEFLRNARYLFITFGTARVYRFKKTGEIVSNCHKIPPKHFNTELLTVSDIVALWTKLLDRLHALFPQLKVIFTISPVRHWKDGAHGNQVSKSVLFLAVEELLNHPVFPQYFPAYELIMDDLRDYRFYGEDMLHPSITAINYIWESFCGCYMEKRTLNTWNEVFKISKACRHRLNPDSGIGIKIFAERMLKKISDIESHHPCINFTTEKSYFENMLKQ